MVREQKMKISMSKYKGDGQEVKIEVSKVKLGYLVLVMNQGYVQGAAICSCVKEYDVHAGQIRALQVDVY
jgi:hypothetical protein